MFRIACPLFAAMVAMTVPAAAESPTEVMHFWVSGSERAALDVIRQDFIRRGGVWVDNPQKNALELRRVLTDRLTTGTSPTALHWHGGIEVGEMAAIGLIGDYDALAARNDWDNVLSDPVKDRIKYAGHYYLAPTGVHSENWVFYNTKVLTDHAIAPPRTMNELVSAVAKLAKSGFNPIAIGKSDWEARMMFDSVLLSALGLDEFKRLFENREASILDTPKARIAFDTFYTLVGFLRPEAQRTAGWSEATADVGAGRSAFIFQGDWAKGELQNLGYRLGPDFGCMLMPGSQNVLTMVVDAFAFPRSLDTSNTEGRDRLIETIYDPEVQIRFNEIKGSVPPRSDVPESRLDACAAIAHKLLQTPGATVTSAEQLVPTAMASDLEVLVGRMLRDRSLTSDQAREALKAIIRSGATEANR